MFKFKNKAGILLRTLVVSAAFLAPASGVAVQDVAGRTLQKMEYAGLDGDRQLLTLTLSAPAPEPTVFTIDRPARLSIDLPATSLAVLNRYQKVNAGNVRAIAAAEAKGRTRVVVELSDLSPYTVRVEGNKVFVQFSNVQGVAAPTVAGKLAPAVTGHTIDGIAGIDFRRGEKGEGRVVITLSNPKTPVDVSQRGSQTVVSIGNVTIADSLLRRLDVLDFATPVKEIEAARSPKGAVILVTPTAKTEFEQVAYQTGNTFSVELHPLSEAEIKKRKQENRQFEGERITLSFQNIQIRTLLQIIGDVAKTNVVVSDSVQGDMAMRLENVPWDQALDTILRTKNLGMQQQGNIIWIAPNNEIVAFQQQEAQSRVVSEALERKVLEIIPLRHVRATDIAPIIDRMFGIGLTSSAGVAQGSSAVSGAGQSASGGGASSGSFKASSTGAATFTDSGISRVAVDGESNSILLFETRRRISEIRELVDKLDVPKRQVLVESRIVVANTTYAKNLGARFGVTYLNDNGGDGLFQTSGGITSTGNAVADFTDDTPGLPVNVGTAIDRLNVNLPALSVNPAGSMAFALLGADYLLDLELSALQEQGEGEILSAPKVVTSSGLLAFVKQGFEVPFKSQDGNGTPKVEFKEALLALQVTPTILPSGPVVMELKITRDEPDFTRLVDGNPPLNRRSLETMVTVQSGQTIVLGGAYEKEQTNTKNKVPLLGDIPLFGQLFRRQSDISQQRELLIFITPKVLNEGLLIN